jgi:hypothetical protein
MSDDDKPAPPTAAEGMFDMAEASFLIAAGAMTIDKQQAEIERLKREWASLHGVERMRFEAVQRMSEEIAKLKEELERVTRARDIACFNIVDLNHQRTTLMDVLGSAMTLIEYMVNEMGAGGVVPSIACQLAKKALDEKMTRLFKGGGQQQ